MRKSFKPCLKGIERKIKKGLLNLTAFQVVVLHLCTLSRGSVHWRVFKILRHQKAMSFKYKHLSDLSYLWMTTKQVFKGLISRYCIHCRADVLVSLSLRHKREWKPLLKGLNLYVTVEDRKNVSYLSHPHPHTLSCFFSLCL